MTVIARAEADSRLGWEPSMEYAGGPDQIRWKLERMKKAGLVEWCAKSGGLEAFESRRLKYGIIRT